MSLCRLNYSQQTKDYLDATDVTITAANFGSTSSVEFLDLNRQAPVFYPFVQYFVQRGYTRDVNIRAAPYDYRLSTGMITVRWADCISTQSCVIHRTGETMETLSIIIMIARMQ